MRCPLALLLVVVLLSVLVSAVHWFLLSDVGSDALLVAVRQPLARHTLSAQGSVEVGNQSEEKEMRDKQEEVEGEEEKEEEAEEDKEREKEEERDKEEEEEEEEEEKEEEEGIPQELLQHKALQVQREAPLQSVWHNVDETPDPPQWSDGDQEEYTVLLDTGDYVLEEKDMDARDTAHAPQPSAQHSHEWPSAAKLTDAHTQSAHHTLPRHRQAAHSHNKPATYSTTHRDRPAAQLQSSRPATQSTPQSSRHTAYPTAQSDGDMTHFAPQSPGPDSPSAPQSGGPVGHEETAGPLHGTFPVQDYVDGRSKETQGQSQAKIIQMSKENYYSELSLSTERASPSRPTSPPLSSLPGHASPSSHRECSVPPCLEFLSSAEKYIYTKCMKRTVPDMGKHPAPPCQCRFVDRSRRKSVALVSLPGSGNTWVRGLLERATGICTGSIYCDRTLREGGFCGEGLRGTNLIAIKTHDSSLAWRGGGRAEPARPVFDKAIFLIRNPFRANIAEWNREISRKYAAGQTGSSHVKYVSSSAFFGSQPGWDRNVRYLTTKWRLMISSNLVKNVARPILVVFYEDLKKDAATELKRMLDFLDHRYTPAQLNSTVQEGYTSYYRNHTDTFEHYTSEQKALVNRVILQTADMVQKTVHKDITSRLRDYVLH